MTKVALLLLLMLLLHGVGMRGSSALRHLRLRLDEVESFIASIEGATVELAE